MRPSKYAGLSLKLTPFKGGAFGGGEKQFLLTIFLGGGTNSPDFNPVGKRAHLFVIILGGGNKPPGYIFFGGGNKYPLSIFWGWGRNSSLEYYLGDVLSFWRGPDSSGKQFGGGGINPPDIIPLGGGNKCPCQYLGGE